MLPIICNSRRKLPSSQSLGLVVLACALLAGCDNRRDSILEIGAEQMYEEGREQLRNSNFAGAITTFENLSIRYPFSPDTRQAQLDLLYAYYRIGQSEAALDVAETFIRENPRLPEIAYCLYMIGVIRFDREPNVIERLFRVDVTERPPRDSQLAFDAFQNLIRQFPDSDFIDDARQRMIFLRNRLALYENHVATYYISRGAYVAAINRAKFALEHYPGAPQLEDSLSLMIEAYEALGMSDLAADTRRVREENFGDLAAAAAPSVNSAQ
jgi:outer membrane protein assembly factor BamD